MKVTITTTSGQKIETIIHGTEATIGRSVKCNVVVPDESLSRQHCKIEIQAGQFFVTDLSSANGVYLDGNKIEANERTSFSSFHQLSLGPLDCLVEESDQSIPQTTSTPEEHNYEENDDSKTIIRKRPVREREPVKKTTIKKENIKLKKPSLGMILPALIILGAIAYFLTAEKEEDLHSSVIETTVKVTPAYKKNVEIAKQVPNEFKATPDYIELSTRKSCIGMQEFCSFLKIDDSQHEGLIKGDEEYIVFLNPANKLKEEKYQKIKENPDALDLVAMERLITSDFFNEYLLQRVAQIQLVINDTSGKPLRVYRFHTLIYSPNKISRIALMTELERSFSEANPKYFWDLLNDKVPKKDLSEK